MNIVYLLLGLFIGLYLKSLISELISKIALQVVKHNPEMIAKAMNETVGKKKMSKFQERLNDVMEKAKQNHE